LFALAIHTSVAGDILQRVCFKRQARQSYAFEGATMCEANQKFFEEGISLFNAGRYFECHEAWEQVWKGSSGAERFFYQGLIQAAVAILHAERGNFRGAASIYGKARTNLEPLPAVHMGIALADFRRALEEFFAAASQNNRLPARPRIRYSPHS
jgi:uncharacterized protein